MWRTRWRRGEDRRRCPGLSGEDLRALREEERPGASGALLIAEGAKRSSPTPSTRDRILGVRGGPGAPPGDVRRRQRNGTAEEAMQHGR